MHFFKTFLALLGAISVAHAHSWIEQLMVIAPNGTFVGEPGYARGNIKRNEPGFGDPPMVHLITGSASDPMCKDSQKSPSSQSASSPRLKAASGADIALRFQENGHVTLPQNQPGKPENRGDIFVYGTTKPKDNELFNDVHGVWTADGKGGDGRGVLLVKAAYDDGQCYQVNGGAISADRQKQFPHPTNQLMGADLWCQTDVRIPADAPTGQPYTLYWVWDWATAAGIDPGLPKGKNETYTTCMDIDTTAAGDFSQKVASGGFVQGQPVENAAVPAQFSRLGDQPAPAEPAQSAPASSAPASVAPVSAPPAPAASALAPAPAPPAASNPAPNPAAPTTIYPIPGPEAPSAQVQSATAPSAPQSSASAASASSDAPLAPVPFPPSPVSSGAISTTILPIPGPDATSTPPSVAPTSTQGSVPSMVTVTKTDIVTTTDFVTLSSATGPTSSAAPKIRGRNPIFHPVN